MLSWPGGSVKSSGLRIRLLDTPPPAASGCVGSCSVCWLSLAGESTTEVQTTARKGCSQERCFRRHWRKMVALQRLDAAWDDCWRATSAWGECTVLVWVVIGMGWTVAGLGCVCIKEVNTCRLVCDVLFDVPRKIQVLTMSGVVNGQHIPRTPWRECTQNMPGCFGHAAIRGIINTTPAQHDQSLDLRGPRQALACCVQ